MVIKGFVPFFCCCFVWRERGIKRGGDKDGGEGGEEMGRGRARQGRKGVEG